MTPTSTGPGAGLTAETADLIAKWDDVNAAAQAMLSAQPWQMTAAAECLDNARKAMRDAVFRMCIGVGRAALSAKERL